MAQESLSSFIRSVKNKHEPISNLLTYLSAQPRYIHRGAFNSFSTQVRLICWNDVKRTYSTPCFTLIMHLDSPQDKIIVSWYNSHQLQYGDAASKRRKEFDLNIPFSEIEKIVIDGLDHLKDLEHKKQVNQTKRKFEAMSLDARIDELLPEEKKSQVEFKVTADNIHVKKANVKNPWQLNIKKMKGKKDKFSIRTKGLMHFDEKSLFAFLKGIFDGLPEDEK